MTDLEQIPRGTLLGIKDSIFRKNEGYPNFTDTYMAKNKKDVFRFGFYWNTSGYYDIDILSMPSYGRRSSDMHSTHRLSSPRVGGGYKICFGNSQIVNSPQAARKWAAIWAELTVDYIKTGKQFPNN